MKQSLKNFLYLTDTKNTIIDERHLLRKEITMNNWIKDSYSH